MIVTIISDASVCQQTGASGWGVWIKCNRGSFQGAGNYKKAIDSVADAEAKAIYNAIFIAIKTNLAVSGDRLVVQSDNQYAIDALKHVFHGGNRCLKDIANQTRKLAKKNGCELDPRWVKGHRPELGGRNYVNEICDGLAKGAMRSQRARMSSGVAA